MCSHLKMLQDEKSGTRIKNLTQTPEDVNRMDSNVLYNFSTKKKILPIEMCFLSLQMVSYMEKSKIWFSTGLHSYQEK